MQIRIKYFGQIARITQKEEDVIEFRGTSISELLDILYSKYKSLKHQHFQVAQNQELVPIETKVIGNDIALLPPFAGG